MACCVYVLKNKTTGRKYVGQTVDLIKRFSAYRRAGHNKNRFKSYIDNAIIKYGWDNFEKNIFYIPEILLDYFEVELIKKLNTLHPNGYNLLTGGNKNKHPCIETIRKLSQSHIGQTSWNKGKKCSIDTINKIKAKTKGINNHNTITWYMSMKNRKHPMFGMHHSDQSKNNISKSKTKNKVICIESGIIYKNAKHAAKQLNISDTNIYRCCNQKRKTCNKLHFEFYKEVS